MQEKLEKCQFPRIFVQKSILDNFLFLFEVIKKCLLLKQGSDDSGNNIIEFESPLCHFFMKRLKISESHSMQHFSRSGSLWEQIY